MSRSVIVATLILSVILLNGCFTIGTLVGGDQARFLGYSGTQKNIESWGEASRIGSNFLYILLVLDFPLSLIMDTVVLPYTLLREFWRPHNPYGG